MIVAALLDGGNGDEGTETDEKNGNEDEGDNLEDVDERDDDVAVDIVAPVKTDSDDDGGCLSNVELPLSLWW